MAFQEYKQVIVWKLGLDGTHRLSSEPPLTSVGSEVGAQMEASISHREILTSGKSSSDFQIK